MQAISIARARTIADHLGALRPRQSPTPQSRVTPLPPSSLSSIYILASECSLLQGQRRGADRGHRRVLRRGGAGVG